MMTGLILLFALIVAALIFRKYWRDRHEKRLRENPPERESIIVCLPGGIGESAKSMTRFWRQVEKITRVDSKARQRGEGQIDLTFIAERSHPDSEPELLCLISADPDKIDTIRRASKQVYNDMSEISLDREKKLEAIAAHLKPGRAEEPEVSEG